MNSLFGSGFVVERSFLGTASFFQAVLADAGCATAQLVSASLVEPLECQARPFGTVAEGQRLNQSSARELFG